MGEILSAIIKGRSELVKYTVLGIVIPKEKFIAQYILEKGEWPAGKDYAPLKQYYGHYLPKYEEDGEEKISGVEKFLESEMHVGLKVFGHVVSDRLSRRLGYEIAVKDILYEFPVQAIDEVMKIYSYALLSTSAEPVKSDNEYRYNLETIKQYASGSYKDKDSGEISLYDGKHRAEMVQFLREMGFSEGYWRPSKLSH